jgi:hypothetical protein
MVQADSNPRSSNHWNVFLGYSSELLQENRLRIKANRVLLLVVRTKEIVAVAIR